MYCTYLAQSQIIEMLELPAQTVYKRIYKHVYQYSETMNCILQLLLKEKLPQVFMQIGWMEDDFRNLTPKVWANMDNPIKRYDFSKVSLIPCMSPSQVALF